MGPEAKLRILLELPPEGVDYGLQKGKGSVYETVQTQRSAGQDLIFEFSVGVRPSTHRDVPSFSGPYVQGPAKERFVYLDIGTYAGQADSCWSRKLKVPLTGITTKMIDAAGVLEARVPGTGRDGGPSCATVKDFDGWQVRRE